MGGRDDTLAAAGEGTLVAAARTGSGRAFALLVARHHPALLRHLGRQTGDPELAADLAQETLLDAWRSLDRLPEDASFAAWLHRIARHNLLAAQRRRRLRRFLSLERLLAGPGPPPPALRRPDCQAAVAERDLVQRVLDELSPALREALLLSSLAGFRTAEVARLLGIAPAAARQRIARAKAQFDARHRALSGGDADAPL